MALSLSPTLSQSLRFPAELERTFQAEYAEKFMGVTRVALFLSALIMAIFGFLDLWSAPNEVVLHQLWAIRYLMICPAFLGAFLWSFHASFYRWMQVGVSSVVCISGLAIGMMVAMARREDAAFNTYYVGMILITLGAYTFIRLRFGYALASGLIIMAGYEVAALVFQRLLVAPMGPSTFVTANFFFITANFVGAFASYYLEVYTRRDFLQRAALEAEKIKAETMLQQEAADALRRSELRFRAVFDQPLLGVRIYAPDGRLQTWNQATEQFYTMSSQDIVELSQTYNVLEDPSVIANGHLPDIQRAFAGEAVTFPPILLSINQRARWTQHYMYPVKDEAGDVREVVSMSRDITAQKEAEEKLRESEEYYRSLIENSSDGISVLDQDGTLRFASPALARIIGYTPEEMLGQSFEPFIDPAHLANTAAHFQNIVANPGVALTTEIHARHKNGTTVIMENVGKLHPNGKVISNSRDITRRKEAEEKIRKLNEELEQRVEERTAESKRLAAIIEAMPDYVGIASLDGTSLYINHAGRQLVGKPLEDTTNAPAWNVIQCYPPDEIPNLQDMFTAMQNGASWAGEATLQHQTGYRIPTDHIVFPLRNAEGQIESYAAVIRDITRRKQAEEELRRAKEAAEEARSAAEAANKAKSTFLANMSHEIRTPMNAVIGMTGLLLNTPLNDKQRDFVETVRTSGDALLTIINDILDFSKIEAGKMDLVQRPLDLRACIESSLDLLAPRAVEKGLELAYVMEDGVPSGILGDDTRLRQILVNLIGNAIKFTERGEVVVNVSSSQTSTSRLSLTSQPLTPDTLHFSVKDTGIGIPSNKLNRLFQSFSQIDSSTTREYGGTGLGLAISKRLAELMGGMMWAESAGLGQGATFHFTLQAQAAPAPTRNHLHNRQPLLVGKRILIVDDNPTNRRILTLQTQTWGMEPIEASTPTEALTLLRTERPFDLTVLDMHMPEMDGAALAAAICAEHEQQGHHFPLVLLTSLGYETRPELEEVACFSAYLTKPVKPSQLYDVLVSVLVDEEREARRAQAFDPLPETNLNHLAEEMPLRILLAEDVVVNQKFALLALGEMGYTADVVANGREALEALKRQPYDLILMDVQMPELDGLDATRLIRSTLPPERQPRIIAMTANAMQGDRELCLEAGMDDYISKPVYLEELQAALERTGEWLKDQRRYPMLPILLDETPLLDPVAFNKILKYPMSSDLIGAYLEEANALIGSLQQAVLHADAHTLRERAHALKGSSSYIGAQRVRALSQELELAGKQGVLAHAPELFARLQKAHAQTQEALTQNLTQN